MKKLRCFFLWVLFLSVFANLCEANDDCSSSKDCFDKGFAALSQGDYDKAISGFTKAVEFDPKNADAYINRGIVYGYKGDYDKSISDYTKGMENGYSGDKLKLVSSYYNRGNDYHNKGDYDKAISDFTKIIEFNPTNVAAHINRGSAYGYKGDYDKAISDFAVVIEIDPNNSPAHANLGVAYYNKGDYEKADSEFVKAIKLNPEFEYPVGNMGILSWLRGDLDDALKQLDKALSMKNESPLFGAIYGVQVSIYDEKNDDALKKKTVRKAEIYFQEQISKYPAEGLNYAGLASIYCEAGIKLDEALLLAEKALKLKPHYESLACLGFCYYKKGYSQQAIRYLEDSAKLNPSYTWNLFRLGKAYKMANDNEKAKEIWQKALKINPVHRFILSELEKIQ